MTQPLCVASVPAAHPYVERVLASPGVVVLPDPHPLGAPDGQWWPPVELSRDWLMQHADAADLLHIHFGTESFTPAELVAVVESAHRVGWPVVQTVHDLVHPQLDDQELYQRQLEALVPLVDHVLTLTPGAAAEIARRFGRAATVLPHPRLLPDHVEPALGATHDAPIVGVHLKDLRPSVDGPGAVSALGAALDLLRQRGLQVAGEIRMHRRVRDEGQRDEVRRLCAARDDIVLLEHDRLDDVALTHALSHLDVCLLPYRFGTHSGWLELCWDLAVPVAAPEIGFFAEQHADATIASFSWTGGGEALAAALERLLSTAPMAGSPARRMLSTRRLIERAATDARTARSHEELYRRLLAEGRHS